MSIINLKASNFKSFKTLEVDLNNFNVLVGANASGKSNFTKIFEFIRDISKYDLKNAVSMQGGAEYLRNINTGLSEDFSLEIISNDNGVGFGQADSLFSFIIKETKYNLTVKFNNNKPNVVEDKLKVKFDLVVMKNEKKKEVSKELDVLANGSFILDKFNPDDIAFEINLLENLKKLSKLVEENDNTKDNLIEIIDEMDEISKELKEELKKVDKLEEIKEIKNIKTLEKFIPSFFKLNNMPDEILIPENPYLKPLIKDFSEIGLYNFDPNLSKSVTSISGKIDLEENGSNLAIVIRDILEDKKKKNKFYNLLEDILPFVNDLDVDKVADKSLLFKLKEKHCEASYLPAPLLSDGTIYVVALIIALYFEDNSLVIIEEPEKYLHPSLMNKIIGMIKEASESKQIIMTTHSPEVLKNIELNDLFLVNRNDFGASIISKPNKKEEIKIFLENNIGIDELFIQNLLEV